LSAQGKGNDLQDLCDEVFSLGGLLSCYIVDERANVRGRNTGEMDLGDALDKSFGAITGVIWGGLKQVEPLAGPVSMVAADFEYFKIIGVPVSDTSFSILLVATLETDPHVLRAKVLGFVNNWLERNPEWRAARPS